MDLTSKFKTIIIRNEGKNSLKITLFYVKIQMIQYQ